MKYQDFDAVVIGGGAAGMAAALKIAEYKHNVALIDREDHLGGVLDQCIHNGFGLHYFKEELTGPEYAQRFIDKLHSTPNIHTFSQTTVMNIEPGSAPTPRHEVICYSPIDGVFTCRAKAVILAMGCRERNRGNVNIPGSRPAGIFTAGLAQRLVNIEGHIPGHEVVIVGSGDIGLIMARRLSLVGCQVKAVIEIMPYPSGLTRNIVQCLNEFNIPLYLSHVIDKIYGEKRITGVDVAPLENGVPRSDKKFHLDCDTLLLSVGLVPENELSKAAGITITPETNGPLVDGNLMTSVPGIFACGNVLHVHDLVDHATSEAIRAGEAAARYIMADTENQAPQYRVKSGANCRYVLPFSFSPDRDTVFSLRSMVQKRDGLVTVTWNNQVIKTIKERRIQPSEMITFTLKASDFAGLSRDADATLAVAIS